MRPEEPAETKDMYECYGCGKRVEGADTRFCSTCGSELRNISRARDL